MKNFKHIYLYFCLTVITFGSAMTAYWTFWPVDVIEFKSPIKLEKKIYHPGDAIVYTVSYCKKVDLPGTIYRSLVNSTRTSFTEVTNNLPVGCHTTKVADLHIPDYTDNGVYHLEATIKYKVNPIRNDMESWKSEEFIIK